MTERPATLRLFLAVWPDAAVRAGIAEHARGWSLPPGCLRYDPRDWHVTLHYIGGLAPARIGALADAVDLPVAPFDLLLDRPRVWPRGLAVLEASAVPPALRDLQRRLGGALATLGVAVEARSYRPHVTLARRAERAVVPKDPAPVTWPARAFVLVASTGNRERRYEILREYRRSAR